MINKLPGQSPFPLLLLQQHLQHHPRDSLLSSRKKCPQDLEAEVKREVRDVAVDGVEAGAGREKEAEVGKGVNDLSLKDPDLGKRKRGRDPDQEAGV